MSPINEFTVTLIIDFGLQAVFGVLAVIFKTEKTYDFIGALTHITCAFVAAFFNYNSAISPIPKIIQAVCVSCWAAKLGLFLLYRVIKAGEDKRFAEAKQSPPRLLFYWFLQGCWVYLNITPSLFLWTTDKTEMQFLSIIGWAIFVFGLIFETVSDYQKTVFRNNAANKGRFITTGLWSISRHPNYFGEILLWFGLFISAAPFFTSPWAYFSILCPIATATQICFLSGIPLLEKSGLERWGKDPDYARYVYSTGVLVPWLVCCECTPLPSRDLLVEQEEVAGYGGVSEGDKGDMVDVDLDGGDKV